MNWFKNLKGKIRFNEPLSKHTTFKIGGPAKIFIEPYNLNDLKLLLRKTKKDKIPLKVIGSGSNLLVSDRGIDGIVIKLSSPYFRKIKFYSGFLEAGAGVSLPDLIKRTTALNLSGCEFLTGIPGTVGAALVMNAGTKDREIKELVKDVTVIDYNGKMRTLDEKNIKFDYRNSSLSKYVVLNTRLRLIKKSKNEILNKIRLYRNYRNSTQDLSHHNAGCIFKNPLKSSSGRLIDECGLKGEHFGDAWVSYKHANFIINKDKARAADVLKLMDYIKQKVKQKFNIALEPEIKIWQ